MTTPSAEPGLPAAPVTPAGPGTPADPGAGALEAAAAGPQTAGPQTAEPPAAPAAAAETRPASPPPGPHRIRRTRISGAWTAAALFAVVLLLLLIFILENGQKVSVTYFGATGHLPLGVALLLAAVLGILLVVIPGTARIVQLRITARRHRKADLTAAVPAAPAQAGG